MNGLLDEWMFAHLSTNPAIHLSTYPIPSEVAEYTKRRNLNRGYMKLEVWQRRMNLVKLAFRLVARISDFKLKSQFVDSAQSVSANIAEGYGRRTLPEYLQFLMASDEFEDFDKPHYEVQSFPIP